MTPPKYSADFKRATVEDVLAGEKRISQICRERGVDQKTLRRWRQDYEQKGPDAWTTPASGEGSTDEKVAQLERLIGQLTVENSVLKKALQHARSLSRTGTLSSHN